jgi:hypothetical protein
MALAKQKLSKFSRGDFPIIHTIGNAIIIWSGNSWTFGVRARPRAAFAAARGAATLDTQKSSGTLIRSVLKE